MQPTKTMLSKPPK